jgi:hypothetical protein
MGECGQVIAVPRVTGCRHNQLRLWFSSMACALIESLRRRAAGELANATCGTIRRKLFKIGALVTVSVRRIKIAMASGLWLRPIQLSAVALPPRPGRSALSTAPRIEMPATTPIPCTARQGTRLARDQSPRHPPRR